MENEALESLKTFLEKKDKVYIDLLNHVIDHKTDLYISNIWSIDNLIDYFSDMHEELGKLKPEDFGDEVEYDITVQPLIELESITGGLNELDKLYKSLTADFQKLVNTNQFDFQKIESFLVKFATDTKRNFAETTLTLNKVNHTVDRIERDANPKKENFQTEQEYFIALARVDAKKL